MSKLKIKSDILYVVMQNTETREKVVIGFLSYENGKFGKIREFKRIKW